MKLKMFLLAVVATLASGSQVHAQQQASPVATQRFSFIKIEPGKTAEWLQLVRDVSMKVAQVRADEGEIISWTVLRSVYPAGQEARADFMISEISAGEPHSSESTAAEHFKKAGIAMTPEEFRAKRGSMTSLVAAEMWRPRIYNGSAQKGNYLFLNLMKVKDAEKYAELEFTIWSPLSQEWIKQGAMTGWIYSTKMLPGGTEAPYQAYTADMFPTMEAAFASRDMQETFARVHPGKNIDEVFDELTKTRDLARRELWVVVERVTKKE